MKVRVRQRNQKLWGMTLNYSFGEVSIDVNGFTEID